MAGSLAGRLDHEQSATAELHPGRLRRSAEHLVRQAARDARRQPGRGQGPAQAAGRNSGGRAIERQEADQAAGPVGQVESGRQQAAGRVGCVEEPDAGLAVEQGDGPTGEVRVAQDPDVGQGVVDPSAEGAQDDDRAGPARRSGEQGELGVRRVLVDR